MHISAFLSSNMLVGHKELGACIIAIRAYPGACFRTLSLFVQNKQKPYKSAEHLLVWCVFCFVPSQMHIDGYFCLSHAACDMLDKLDRKFSHCSMCEEKLFTSTFSSA